MRTAGGNKRLALDPLPALRGHRVGLACMCTLADAGFHIQEPPRTRLCGETSREHTRSFSMQVAESFLSCRGSWQVRPLVLLIQLAAARSSLSQYRQMYKQSIEDPTSFWRDITDAFYWHK